MADPKNDSGSKATWFVGAAYGGRDDQLLASWPTGFGKTDTRTSTSTSFDPCGPANGSP